MNHLGASGILILDFVLRTYLCYRIVRRRLPVGSAWAWICLILFLPLVGTFIYVNLGEYRLGRRRSRRLKAATEAITQLSAQLLYDHNEPTPLVGASHAFSLAVQGFFKGPIFAYNDVRLLNDAGEAFPSLIADIDAAKSAIDLEFYIWSDGGRADDFGEAVIRAASRGVRCRLLVDQIGSAEFVGGPMAKKLVKSGVELCVALPSGIIRSFFARPDLRIHRKIAVIDGRIAYTGSLNLADPKLFKRSSGVGEWVDALCRLTGPAVKALELVFLSDWCVEQEIDFSAEEKKFQFYDIAQKRSAHVQCLASGPAIKNSAIEQVLVMAIYSSQEKLVLTTPYFVPNEVMLYALIAAARKGVEVTLIVPARVDSHLIQYASRAFLRDLVQAGVRVALYNGGMLHTKSVCVDDELCLFGSLNLDPRSLRINFEVTLAIYDKDFATALHALQERYLRESTILDLTMCESQTWFTIFREDLARLVGPVL